MLNEILNLIGVQCITTATRICEKLRFIHIFLKKANPSNPSEKIANFTQLCVCSLASHEPASQSINGKPVRRGDASVNNL